MYRFDIINYLAKKINAIDYLEIGVYKGYSFERVNIINKDGVDPEGQSEHTNFRITSDKFFDYIKPDKLYDIIFIDGLHLYEQSLKDFNNSLLHLKPNGYVVFHDTSPPTEKHATEEWILDAWNGTVYKTIVKLRSERDDLNIFTVDTDWGVTVVCRGEQTPLNLDLNECLNFEYFDKNRKELLNLITIKDFVEDILKIKL